jgi:hypothetical protein
MTRFSAVLLSAGICFAAGMPAYAQQAPKHAAPPGPTDQSAPSASIPGATIPDSIRQRVGYQHWKGAAIGGGLGALGGFVLALGAGGQCDDCSSDTAPIGKVTLIGAGIGSALGFLVGLASPRYRWVHTTAQ